MWAPDRHSHLKIRAQSPIFLLKGRRRWKNEKLLLQMPFQVAGWKYCNFCTLQKAGSASGWHLNKKPVPMTRRCSSQLGYSAARFLWWSLACGKWEGDMLPLLHLKWLSAPYDSSVEYVLIISQPEKQYHLLVAEVCIINVVVYLPPHTLLLVLRKSVCCVLLLASAVLQWMNIMCNFHCFLLCWKAWRLLNNSA